MKNRRSFLIDLATGTAGAWIAVTGSSLLGLMGVGCSDDGGSDPSPVKYGAPPQDGGLDRQAPKYGGPPQDSGADHQAMKYGGPPQPPPDGGSDADPDAADAEDTGDAAGGDR